MASELSGIRGHTEFRFLEELDQASVTQGEHGQSGAKGIKVHHNLGVLDRLFGWLRDQTVEIKIGAKDYIFSKRSLENFLTRQGAIKETDKKNGKVPYEKLVEKLKDLLEA